MSFAITDWFQTDGRRFLDESTAPSDVERKEKKIFVQFFRRDTLRSVNNKPFDSNHSIRHGRILFLNSIWTCVAVTSFRRHRRILFRRSFN